MKLKFLSSLSFFVALSFIYVTMSSNSGGKYNNGTSCGSCHGSANTATTVSLTGLPTTYVVGQTYNLTFTVSNPTNTHSGFNVKCSSGMLMGGTGSSQNPAMNQVTQTSTSTTNSWTFSWTAPSTPTTVTFNCVGNSVNNNSNDDNNGGDQWNSATYTVTGSYPTGVDAIHKTVLNCYPNPATSQLNVEGVSSVQVLNMFGQVISVSQEKVADHVALNLTNVANGMYILVGETNGKTITATFVKQ